MGFDRADAASVAGSSEAERACGLENPEDALAGFDGDRVAVSVQPRLDVVRSVGQQEPKAS